MCVYIYIYIYHIFFIHSLVNGHLVCSHILDIVSDTSNNFFNKVQKTLTTGKNDKLYLKIKTLTSAFQKILLWKVEKQVTGWDKIFTICVSHKGFMSNT